MITLYSPVLIETAEQAEALPIGTFAVHVWGMGADLRTRTQGGWMSRSGSVLPPSVVVGWTALVPIEAEEEVVVDTADLNLDPEHEYWSDDPNLLDAVRDAPKRTRLVTTWTPAEEA
ncbi:hypothetical protein ACTXI9_01580 [Brachybacterium alimentarium]|uniref:hypothetical protein n=1 Tax=Brachybacterium alimentarium TaxID=47845 RepID=UPI003FD19CE3